MSGLKPSELRDTTKVQGHASHSHRTPELVSWRNLPGVPQTGQWSSLLVVVVLLRAIYESIGRDWRYRHGVSTRPVVRSSPAPSARSASRWLVGCPAAGFLSLSLGGLFPLLPVWSPDSPAAATLAAQQSWSGLAAASRAPAAKSALAFGRIRGSPMTARYAGVGVTLRAGGPHALAGHGPDNAAQTDADH